MKKIILLILLLIFTGCVSTGKYQACLDELARLNSEKEKLEKVVNKTESNLNDCESKKSELEKEVDNLKSTLNASKDEMTVKILELNNSLLTKDKEIKACNEKIISLSNDLKNKDLTIQDLKTERVKLLKEKVELEKEKEELNRISKIKEDELTTKIGELNISLASKDSEIKSLEEKISFLTNDLKNKDLTVQDLKKELANLSQEKLKIMEEKEKAISQLKNTYNSLVSELKEEIKKGEIEVTQLRDKLTLQMVEKILFDSGSAEIKGSGKKIIDRVAEILKNVTDKQIRIEGHTDNIPIGPRIAKKFPTNWELSTARATTVVRYLIEKGGINPKILSAVGYADNMPVASNDTEEGRAKNRRIEIVLSPID